MEATTLRTTNGEGVVEEQRSGVLPPVAPSIGDPAPLGLAAFALTTFVLIASLRVSVAVMLVFLLLAATFFVLGIGEANGTDSIVKAGGWLGIATAIVAWYASFASVTNKTIGRIVMPVRELKK